MNARRLVVRALVGACGGKPGATRDAAPPAPDSAAGDAPACPPVGATGAWQPY